MDPLCRKRLLRPPVGSRPDRDEWRTGSHPREAFGQLFERVSAANNLNRHRFRIATKFRDHHRAPLLSLLLKSRFLLID
jgi:hypothetical protein